MRKASPPGAAAAAPAPAVASPNREPSEVQTHGDFEVKESSIARDGDEVFLRLACDGAPDMFLRYWERSKDKELGKGNFGKVRIGEYGDLTEVALDRLIETSSPYMIDAVYTHLKRRGVPKGSASSAVDEVAVKLLSLEMGDTNKDSRHLQREISVQSRISHPNVVRLHMAIGWSFAHLPKPSRNRIALVIDKCDGDLESKLGTGKGRGAIGYPEILHITRDCAAALSYLRENKLLHRDIKARNILYKNYKPRGRDIYLLADLGLARALTTDAPIDLTQCGTPGYVAPEVLESPAFSYEIDSWSLGITLCRCITGTSLFAVPKHEKRQGDFMRKNFADPNVWSKLQEIGWLKECAGTNLNIDLSLARRFEALISGMLLREPRHRTSASGNRLLESITLACGQMADPAFALPLPSPTTARSLEEEVAALCVPCIDVFDISRVQRRRVIPSANPHDLTFSTLVDDVSNALWCFEGPVIVLHPEASCNTAHGADNQALVPAGSPAVCFGVPSQADGTPEQFETERLLSELHQRWSSSTLDEESLVSSADSYELIEIELDNEPTLKSKGWDELRHLDRAAGCFRSYLHVRTDQLRTLDAKLVQLICTMEGMPDADFSSTLQDCQSVRKMYSAFCSRVDDLLHRVLTCKTSTLDEEQCRDCTVKEAVDEAKRLLHPIFGVAQEYSRIEGCFQNMTKVLALGAANMEQVIGQKASPCSVEPSHSMKERVETEIRAYEDRIAAMETEMSAVIEGANREKVDLRATIARLQDEVRKLHDEKECLSNKCKGLLTTNGDLHVKIAGLQDGKDCEMLEAVRAELDTLRGQRAELYESFRRAKEVHGGHNALRARIEELEAKLESMPAPAQEMQDRADVHRSETFQKLQSPPMKSEVLLKELEVTNQSLTCELGDTRAANDALRALVADLTADNDALERSLGDARAQIAYLQPRLREIDGHDGSASCKGGSEPPSKTLETDVSELRMKYAAAVSELDAVSALVEAQHEQHHDETERWAQRIEDLECALRSHHSESSDADEEKARIYQALDAAQDDARRASAKCDEQVKRVVELEHGIAQGADTIADLQSQIGALHGRIEDSVKFLADQIGGGSDAVHFDSAVLLQWHGEKWSVLNCPDLHIADYIVDQLRLEKDTVHLVRVVQREGSEICVERI
mmetsp:Transcript_31342/g.82136  ORF Transcript_31342/g.82136 Transcript_31342/m.82136 type:complete len:1162 (+) Transcript_31342:208-3693(+)|eukprot:CAMPEP_0182922224 /NCGR_PEP_ID=MMETSP0105_2-20130417/4657_1 /TAXON_ID=81532 ORGANISM="Acanthoeca-like sp., Strain 10tr" /NCGR_SAMPLE_ID=MMETSP0105_2 /ASSEMBLY_ACC=CAM_ASM_000205 /LENGTH=1161 /DNA_ID=CAMNT_0025059823 /DNA_START=135 /DNA_END=3620 /DNA_ORIENTATION=-